MKELTPVSNQTISRFLLEVADLLEQQHANPYRVAAYRAAADVVDRFQGSVQDLAVAEGRAGLDRLPKIGASLAATIEEIAFTGGLRLRDRLAGMGSPVEIFTSVPGIGETLARKIHGELKVDTLEGLEAAAHDGRLDQLEGFGARRVQGIRAVVGDMLGRSSRKASRRVGTSGTVQRTRWPNVAEILHVDRNYRRRAAAGDLPRVAPQRNNPKADKWLPVLHEDHNGWHFTAMFSNSDRAHRRRKTRDWVVIYYEKDGREGQSTVVTEFEGALVGRRVVRSKKAACKRHYAKVDADLQSKEMRA